MGRNYLDPTILANFDASSQLAGFPKENLLDSSRRALVYRTGGRWIITTGTIKFKEAGVTKTATVAAGSYAPTSALITALSAAFNAAGVSSTYTASVDTTTGKIKITSNGIGGTFQIIWTDSVSTAMADVLGFKTASDDTGALTYVADVLKIAHPNERLVFDLGIETNPRNFLVTGPRNVPLGLSPAGTYFLQGNPTNPTDWTLPAFETQLTHDDEIMLAVAGASGTYLAPYGHRYWSLELNDVGDTASGVGGNANGYLELGVIFLGDELFSTLSDQINRGAVKFGFSSRYVDRSTTETSEGGNTTSNVKPKTQEYTFNWNGVTKEQIEELSTFWEQVGTHTGFFIVFDPNAPINWTGLNRSAKFVKFSSEPTWDIEFTDYFLMSMSVREEL